MEENVLIKGEISKKMKNTLLAIAAICGLFAIIMCLVLTIPHKESRYDYYRDYYDDYYDDYDDHLADRLYKDIGWSCAFGGGEDDMALYLVVFILGCLSLIGAIVTFILFWAFSKMEISITDHNVKGKTYFGKEVVLPLYMVSSYSTRKMFSTIAVATSSGITKFAFIDNYKEVGEVLAQKINLRQENTSTSNQQQTTQTYTDELVKLKNLLDSGILTQEEFDAKKKELLGL